MRNSWSESHLIEGTAPDLMQAQGNNLTQWVNCTRALVVTLCPWEYRMKAHRGVFFTDISAWIKCVYASIDNQSLREPGARQYPKRLTSWGERGKCMVAYKQIDGGVSARQSHRTWSTPFYNSAITNHVVCARIVAEIGSHFTKMVPVQSHSSSWPKVSESLWFHRSHFAQYKNPVCTYASRRYHKTSEHSMNSCVCLERQHPVCQNQTENPGAFCWCSPSGQGFGPDGLDVVGPAWNVSFRVSMHLSGLGRLTPWGLCVCQASATNLLSFFSQCHLWCLRQNVFLACTSTSKGWWGFPLICWLVYIGKGADVGVECDGDPLPTERAPLTRVEQDQGLRYLRQRQWFP